MIIVKTNQSNYIELRMDDSKNKYQRFPNQIIWSINTYLSNRFKLYEYYFSKKSNKQCCMSFSKVNLRKKYLCFSALDPMYISLVDFEIDEYKAVYENHLSEFDSFEQFFECYSMEEITEMSYIAIDTLEKFISKLSVQLSYVFYKRQCMLSRIIDSHADVAVHIGDHCYMTIQSKHPEIIADLLKIIKPCQDS